MSGCCNCCETVQQTKQKLIVRPVLFLLTIKTHYDRSAGCLTSQQCYNVLRVIISAMAASRHLDTAVNTITSIIVCTYWTTSVAPSPRQQWEGRHLPGCGCNTDSDHLSYLAGLGSESQTALEKSMGGVQSDVCNSTGSLTFSPPKRPGQVSTGATQYYNSRFDGRLVNGQVNDTTGRKALLLLPLMYIANQDPVLNFELFRFIISVCNACINTL